MKMMNWVLGIGCMVLLVGCLVLGGLWLSARAAADTTATTPSTGESAELARQLEALRAAIAAQQQQPQRNCCPQQQFHLVQGQITGDFVAGAGSIPPGAGGVVVQLNGREASVQTSLTPLPALKAAAPAAGGAIE